jgi:hypothetical protein
MCLWKGQQLVLQPWPAPKDLTVIYFVQFYALRAEKLGVNGAATVSPVILPVTRVTWGEQC